MLIASVVPRVQTILFHRARLTAALLLLWPLHIAPSGAAPAQTGYDERYRRSNNKTGAWRQ
ncbi:hypothetical protein SEEC0006_01231 [Salmonella enterica subsp. enterica serovar Choleraesuis str. 0006]|nr:hypothetical protein SEEC0006_01231 [Salmonella enterica subsp. enterica serovar Choleraesuis str. 0006]